MIGEDLPVLIGQQGPLNGMRWSLESTITIGRDAECDIVIADRQVSRYHARFSTVNEGILLEDLASKNGTYLNGKQITLPQYVQDGDVVFRRLTASSQSDTVGVIMTTGHFRGERVRAQRASNAPHFIGGD